MLKFLLVQTLTLNDLEQCHNSVSVSIIVLLMLQNL